MPKTNRERKKKPKVVYIEDDGRTLYDMSGVGSNVDKVKKDDGVKLSKKEKRAMLKAAFLYYLPKYLIIIGCFAVAAVLAWLWLNKY